jgi:DNA-binding CsgD family transcriptional regulator
MQAKDPSALSLLSPREQDCLRLLQAGLSTPSVASNLGISPSTLHKHLASARQKLGVTRTAHAVLMYQRAGEPTHHDDRCWHRAVDVATHRIPLLEDFANALASCQSFDEAWAALLSHMQQFGMSFVNLGVIAEPPGQLTNGAKLLRTTMPDELLQLYEAVGGVSTDPNVHYISAYRKEALIDGESVITAQLPHAPKSLRTLLETLHDAHLHRILLLPDRDEATAAPLAIVLAFDRKAAAEIRHRMRDAVETLKATQQIFWHTVQTKRLLTESAGLSIRQRNALTLAARGFTSAETAEHMELSTRSTEKLLAAARNKLGARSTASAIYRATVYRALA